MTTFKVQKRDMDKKAKQVRREGFVTGNLFGKDIDGSIPLVIERKEAEKIQRECLKGTQLYLELDGKKYDVLLKELDYDPMKNQILEIDFQSLVKGEKVHTVAEIVLQNKDKVAAGLLEQLLKEISYKAVPEAIIDKIEIDCSKLKLGDTLTVADLDIAKNKAIEIMTHMDTPVVSVIAPRGNAPEETVEETAEEKE
ncbi:MAG TPA: 50S ribosomal protein L25 [Lachnospiraceae bacterium]|nr:50S ribosomal protein L25 [Lachnospiraceae bacterium]